jgi:Ala-tRNA(Pro) deacylase
MNDGSPHLDAVLAWLDARRVAYELVEHPATFAAAEEAKATGVEPREAAKTLALHDRGGYRLAVIPASRQLDLHRTREALGATGHLRLASEEEMRREFPAFEVGALPPFGPLLPAPEVVDIRLLYLPKLVCSAGDHRHSLSVDPRDLVRVTEPLVADICEHTGPAHERDFADLPRV